MIWKFFLYIILINLLINLSNSKYLEGHLKTLDDWSFLARFCFLSGRGRYEYEIEFEKRYGEPKLLLYYDDKTQWPAVYKSGKTCIQKLSVLHAAGKQIVVLSARPPYSMDSGCQIQKLDENDEPIGTQKPKTKTNHFAPTIQPPGDENDSSYYDQFLITSTKPTEFDDNSSILFDPDESDRMLFNETEILNLTNPDEKIRNAIDTGFSYRNKMDNDSTYENEVEELFEKLSDSLNLTRVPREALPPVFMSPSKKSKIVVSCHNIGGFTSSRERWWYIAVANCGSQKGLDIKYKFRMTNGPPGDFWHEHFSADEMYIPPILLTECLVYSILLLAIFLCAIELKTRHLFHCTYRLFAFSAFIHWIGVLTNAVAWSKYAITGLGPHTVLGGIFMGASEISFITLMLLMAKGYTITRARLSSCTTVKLTVFVNLYIVTYISLYIYQADAFDPGEVLNLYESPAGFGLTGLRCGAWCAFLIAIATTLKKHPEKNTFYYPFGLLGSLWLLGGSVLTFIGVGILDPWVRESVMCGSHAAIAFGGHAAFLWLTWPSRANKSFPYHVRTNHVGIAANDDGLDYPRHPYAPTTMGQDPNIVIPLSRHTEELLSGVYNQYIREREFYNSASTPISHISFPNNHGAPIELDNGGVQFRQQSSDEAEFPEIIETNKVDNGSQIIEQSDSGHPSLENSNFNSHSNSASPPNEIEMTTSMISPDHKCLTKTISLNRSNSRNDRNDRKPPDVASTEKPAVLPHNPFLVTNNNNNNSSSSSNSNSNNNNNSLNTRGPNKVILEPLEHSTAVRNGIDMGDVDTNSVPKHLFAVKIKK